MAAAAGRGGVLGSRAGRRRCCGAIGVALLVIVVLAGYLGAGTALDNLAPTFILITFWVGLVFASVLFGDVFRAFSPWRAIGRVLPSQGAAARTRSSSGRWPAAAGLLDLHLDRAGRRAGASTRRRWSPPRSATRCSRWSRRSSGASRRGRATARRSRVYYNLFSRIVGLRDARPRRRRCGRRSAASRGSTRSRDGRLRRGDDRHRHVRRAQPGPAVEGPRRSTSPTSSTSLGIASSTPRRRSSTRSGCSSAWRSIALFYRLGIAGARSVGGEHRRRRSCGARSSTRSCRSRWSTSPRTT